MAAGYPVKVNYLTGDVLTATNLNDLAGTVNLYDPTAKGDLFPATAADAVSRLAVGANATVLTADSTTATGLKWAAPATPSAAKSYALLSTTATNTSATSYTVSGLSGYDEIRVIFASIGTTDTGNNGIFLQLNNATTDYIRAAAELSPPSTLSASLAVSDAGFKLCSHGTVVFARLQGYVNISGANTSGVKLVTIGTGINESGNPTSLIGGGAYTSTSVISSIKIIQAGGATFSAGTMYVYGAV